MHTCATYRPVANSSKEKKKKNGEKDTLPTCLQTLSVTCSRSKLTAHPQRTDLTEQCLSVRVYEQLYCTRPLGWGQEGEQEVAEGQEEQEDCGRGHEVYFYRPGLELRLVRDSAGVGRRVVLPRPLILLRFRHRFQLMYVPLVSKLRSSMELIHG